MVQNPTAPALMLVGMGAAIVAAYLLYGHGQTLKNPKIKESMNRGVGSVLTVIGILTLIITIDYLLLGPIPAQYVELFGTTLAIFSLLMIIGGISLYKGSDLRPVSYLATLGGIWQFQAANIVNTFALTKTPLVTVALFVFAGLAGLSFLPATHISEDRPAFRRIKILAGLVTAVMALIALYLGINAMFGHIASAVAAAA